ncbi:MAG: SDR family oxidoreductase [Terracidiphilus sp.]|jgi:NAD(P)-dependent dehydrogenase (short-subunit alcohol dehydrogenase family)
MRDWTCANIPPQAGRQAVVTGGSSGLGLEIALALARAGSDVILAGRDGAKGRAALARIRPLAPAAVVQFEKLDLADLTSVADFAARIAARKYPIDLLVNNAGMMTAGARQVTVDGFEMQLGANYLGHFALTCRLLPLLRTGQRPRVVQLSSLAHRQGSIDFEDLQLERGYSPWKAYCQSKLAMLMFALDLQRRSATYGWRLLSAASHPGYVRTGLAAKSPVTRYRMATQGLMFLPLLSQSAEEGALPTLYAATSRDALPGGYYGSTGRFEMVGPPGLAVIGEKARDAGAARRLWEVSEELTGVKWPVG